jgi:hypothetical protein
VTATKDVPMLQKEVAAILEDEFGISVAEDAL